MDIKPEIPVTAMFDFKHNVYSMQDSVRVKIDQRSAIANSGQLLKKMIQSTKVDLGADCTKAYQSCKGYLRSAIWG